MCVGGRKKERTKERRERERKRDYLLASSNTSGSSLPSFSRAASAIGPNITTGLRNPAVTHTYTQTHTHTHTSMKGVSGCTTFVSNEISQSGDFWLPPAVKSQSSQTSVVSEGFMWKPKPMETKNPKYVIKVLISFWGGAYYTV